MTSLGALCADMPGMRTEIFYSSLKIAKLHNLLNWYNQMINAQRTPEKPCLNDVTEVGTWRKMVVAVAIFLVVLTLLPVWDELAEELGIGLVSSF